MRIIVAAAAALVLSGPTVATASVVTDAFTSFWAMGDSLTDDGNLNRFAFATGISNAPTSDTQGTAAYYQTGSFWSGYSGRFSNGATFAEHIADAFSDAGKVEGNLAYGGAQALGNGGIAGAFIDDLGEQLDRMEGGLQSQFGDRPLVSLLMGANDIFEALRSSDPMIQALDAARRAADAVGDAVAALRSVGVDDFLISNLPDIGLTPAYSLIESGLKDAATAASLAFNERLAARVADLRGDGANIVDLDLFAQIRDIVANPGAFGFGDVTNPCMFDSAARASMYGQEQYCTDAESQARLFFDSVHPNLLAHRQTADLALALLEQNLMPAAVPLPGGFALLLGGVAVMMPLRRRRRDKRAA